MEKRHDRISIEDMDSLNICGRVGYRPYAGHARFFALFDDGRTYHHRDGEYVLFRGRLDDFFEGRI